MVVVYNQEVPRIGNTTGNRHAIYHFYNTRNNRSVPLVSIAGNLFYKNRILKEEHGYQPYNLRRRVIEFTAGDKRAAYTLLNKIVKNRYRNVHTWLRPEVLRNLRTGAMKVTNLNNTHLKKPRNITQPSFNPEHWGHFKQYTRLLRAMHNSNGPAYNKVTRTRKNPIPNAQLINMLKNYYSIITRGTGSDRYTRVQPDRIDPILQRIQALAHNRNVRRRQRVVESATRIQSAVRGRIARKRAATIRAARTTLRATAPAFVPRQTTLRANARAFVPRPRINAATATANLRRILGINASRR